MPQVASKASVLKPQHNGLTQRERMGEPKDSTSPFSILLAEAGGEAPPRPNAKRTNGASATQRTEPPRSHMHRTDAERPQQTDEEPSPDAAAQACATQTSATEQDDDEAAKPFEIAAAGQAAVTPELAPQPADSTSDTSNEATVATDAALAASVETPPSPAQPVATETPSLAAAATPAATAPTDPDTVESAAAAGVTATAAGEIAAVAAVGASTPTVPQAPPPATPAPPASEQAAQQQAAAPPPTMPEAKPASVEATTTPEAANQQPQPSATPETAAAIAPTAGAEHAETKTAPEKPAHAETPSPPSARPHGPDATERPQNASAVSDFIHAAQQPTPDGSQLAHLQSGRDFGQAVAATAHAAQSADASNPLVSSPVPLESLAVEIASRALSGRNRFEIRLDPPELGRIDVRLDIDRSGNVTSRLVVEKAETLDVLRRDAHQLERALQDAGLKTSDNSLQFSLRDQSSAERDDRNDSNNPRILIADPELPATEAASTAYGLTLRGGSGIDIRV